MSWIKAVNRDTVLSNVQQEVRMPAADAGGEGGGGGGTEIPQPLIVSSSMFKNLDAATGYIAMHLFINSSFGSVNGTNGKTPQQAAYDAVVNAEQFVSIAGNYLQELCGE